MTRRLVQIPIASPWRAGGMAVVVAVAVGALVVAAAIVASAAVAQASTGPSEVVSPLPGTPDANPATQISFLGAPASRLRDIVVEGSESGSHAGRLRYYSTHTGGSFLPSHPGTARPTSPAGEYSPEPHRRRSCRQRRRAARGALGADQRRD